MKAAQANQWRRTIVYAIAIAVAWNSLYVFSCLPGGAQHIKKNAQMAWGTFGVCMSVMIPYLIFGTLGLLLRIGNVDKRRLAKTAISFGILVATTLLALMIGAQL